MHSFSGASGVVVARWYSRTYCPSMTCSAILKEVLILANTIERQELNYRDILRDGVEVGWRRLTSGDVSSRPHK